MFGEFDSLNPLSSRRSGGSDDRALTPQQQRRLTPTSNRRNTDQASAERQRLTDHTNLTPSRRTPSRKKERQWENNNLIPLLATGHKIPLEEQLGDPEGKWDPSGRYILNMDRFKMNINPKSLFADLFLPENSNVLNDFRKCQNEHLDSMERLSNQFTRSASLTSTSSSSSSSSQPTNRVEEMRLCEIVWIGNVQAKLRKVAITALHAEAGTSDVNSLADFTSAIQLLLTHFAEYGCCLPIEMLSTNQLAALELLFVDQRDGQQEPVSIQDVLNSLWHVSHDSASDSESSEGSPHPCEPWTIVQKRICLGLRSPLHRLLVYCLCQFYSLPYKSVAVDYELKANSKANSRRQRKSAHSSKEVTISQPKRQALALRARLSLYDFLMSRDTQKQEFCE